MYLQVSFLFCALALVAERHCPGEMHLFAVCLTALGTEARLVLGKCSTIFIIKGRWESLLYFRGELKKVGSIFLKV